MAATGDGTKDSPWELQTAPGTSAYQMWRDESAEPPAGTPCGAFTYEQEIGVFNLDAIDVLVVLDTGPSMGGEQARLQVELERMIDLLTKPEREEGDPEQFSPGFGPDLHLAFVSADLGNAGAAGGGCEASGDSGALQDGAGACPGQSEPFLWVYRGHHDFVAIAAQADDEGSFAMLRHPGLRVDH